MAEATIVRHATRVRAITRGCRRSSQWVPMICAPCASSNPFDRGLHTWTPTPTFVSSGLGEVGLPIRLLNPPVIDVLTIR